MSRNNLLGIFLLLSTSFAFSQSNVVFNRLQVQNGLSQSTVYCMLQDADGFMWIGTRDGLNKYDGNTFRIYRNVADDSTSIVDNQVFCITEDKVGQLWLGTNNGLCVYNKNTDSFRRYVNDKNNPKSINNNHVYAVLADTKGNIWVGTDGGGISRFNPEENAFYPTYEILKEAKVRAIIETYSGEIWFGTKGDGLLIYTPENNSYNLVQVQKNNAYGLLSNSVRFLFQDSKNNLWIGTDEKGLTQYNAKNKTYLQYTADNKNQLCHNAVRSIYEDNQGDIWVGTRVGLNRLHKQNNSFSYYFHDEQNPHSLSNNSVRSIIQDHSGNLWFGTYYGGINVIYGSSANFELFIPNVFSSNSLSYQIVSSFAEDANRNIWIGTEGEGINRFNPEKRTFMAYKHNAKGNGLANNNVKALCIDDDNNLWIGTYGGGLDVYDIKRNSFVNYQFNKADSNSIASNYIYSIYHDSKNRTWVGTNMGGINIFDKQLKVFKRIKMPSYDGGFVKGETINDIIEDKLGNIWFASDIGLIKYDNETFGWVNLLANKKALNALSFGLDGFRNLWVGTEGNGIFSIDVTTDKMEHYYEKDDLQGFNFYGIKTDSRQNLWLSTNNGLLRFPLSKRYNLPNKTDTFMVVYDENDGLQANEFNRGASFASSDSLLYFGGLKGFNVFNPNKISQNKTKPPVCITAFYISNKKIENYDNASPLKQPIGQTKELTLNHKQSSFSFEFVALNYDKPQKNKYAYMLEGFDKEWVNSGKSHMATYTNIFPGTYVFKVKASNNDNLWNDEGTQIKITVLPPFWRTKWALLLYFLFVTMLMLVFRRMIVFNTNQKNLLENERLEKQRIEELNQMKLRFFTNISHEFRTPLTLISGPLEKLMNNQQIAADETHYLYALMHKNMLRLHRLINQLMDFRKLENKKMKLNVSSGSLSDFIQDIVHGFAEFCKQKNIDLKVVAEDNNFKDYWFDKNVVDNIIFILLSNAIKFTPSGGTISVVLQSNNQHAVIKVVDSGIGISSEKLKRIFERFYSDDSLKYSKSIGTGIGLSFAQSLVELHKSEIKVESQEGKGTCFTITMPINQEFYSIDEKKVDTKYSLNSHPIPENEIMPLTAEQSADKDSETLLIVEDNIELRAFVMSHFKHYNLLEAENGKEAFKLAKKHLPDLVISDVMMPVMDGMALCKSLKNNQITSHIPVVLLTAKANIENKIEGASYGADVYMEKPFNIALLEANVSNLLLQRKALRERFAGHVVSNNSEVNIEHIEDKFIKKAQEIIYQRKSDPELTVEQLGDELGLSRSQLFRKFKALTDHSPNEFIKVVRLKYATELMAKEDLNINQITFECGFTSASHFIASFKKYYNKTPKEYSVLINQTKKTI